MNEYEITYYLNSGNIIKGVYKGNESNTDLVMKKLFQGNVNSFTGLLNITKDANLLVKLGSVEAYIIKPVQKETK